jgi:hypothetical protein
MLNDSQLRLAQVVLQLVQLLVVALGFTIAIRQFRLQSRAHLLELHRQVFRMVDDSRVQRHQVYSLDRNSTFQDESWLSDAPPTGVTWARKDAAEEVFRAFDQLGLLVREGRVPVNIISRFYVVPILGCWYQLSPYIRATRNLRRQPSHGWEFENLVHRIILPGIAADNGVWEGVKSHDFPPGSDSVLEALISEGVDAAAPVAAGRLKRLWYL